MPTICSTTSSSNSLFRTVCEFALFVWGCEIALNGIFYEACGQFHIRRTNVIEHCRSSRVPHCVSRSAFECCHSCVSRKFSE